MSEKKSRFIQLEINTTGTLSRIGTVTGSLLFSIIILLAFIMSALAEGGGRYKSPEAWSFGVYGDTQWTIESDKADPNYISGSILNQVIGKFICHDVKFVIAMGDMSDRAQPGAMASLAKFIKPLYDAGIGFFPMRGNHETYGWFFNYAPVEAEISEMLENFPQTRKAMFGVTNISSPEILDGEKNPILKGLSYSFDYGPKGSNARFVILDTEDVECETTEITRNGITNPYWPKKCTNYPIPSQQKWISDRLNKATRNTTHAFVLAHHPPMAESHIDSPFNPSSMPWETLYYLDHNPEGQNKFFKSMDNNGAKFYLGAHDHMHQRSIIKSPDGKSRIEEIISAGLSTKFYQPSPIPYPKYDKDGKVIVKDQWAGQKIRETSLSQEVNNIGYYVYTVDGPRVTADYYSDSKGNFQSNKNFPYGSDNPDYPAGVTPDLKFVKKETFGYSLNGKEFLIAQGASYTVVQNSFEKTTAKILDGVNKSSAVDENNRGLTKAVDTGWVKNPDPEKLISDIFSLWGMSDLGSNGHSDTYVLSMSFDSGRIKHLKKGGVAIATFVNGKWINAVDEGFGGTRKFVPGKYKPGYAIGTYGYDLQSKTAWAVLNYNADFAVAENIDY